MGEGAGKEGVSKRTAFEEAGVIVRDPEVWAAGEHLLLWFWALDGQRGNNGYGPLPFSAADVQAWSALTGMEVLSWEAETLFAMDRARLAGAKEAEEPDTKEAANRLTPMAFDAVFG